MVLGVVIASSVRRDKINLREAYALVGIREYWLVDVLGEDVLFDILRLTSRGYASSRKTMDGSSPAF